jgi:5-methylthioribose kinase
MAEYDDKGRELIGIVEAQVQFGHSREWYTRRMNDGRLETVLKVGTAKKFLVLKQVAEYVRLHGGEQD